MIPNSFDLTHEEGRKFFGETGTVVKGGFSSAYEVEFDDEETQSLYMQFGKREFEGWSLKPTQTKGKRDKEFTNKLKDALSHFIESEDYKVATTIEEDYDGKFIQTAILMDEYTVYMHKYRINDWGEPVVTDY